VTPEAFVIWQEAMVGIFLPLIRVWLALLLFGAFTMTTWLVASHLIRGGLSRF
jgi:hypothetical protein